MFTGFAHAELLSLLWPVVGVVHGQVTTGNSVNSYDADPQPAAGIDTWQAGGTMFTNMLMCIGVTEATAGALAISLMDAKDAITTANGAASTKMVATLEDITAVGLYIAEFQFSHVFADATARVVADADNLTVRRYHSIRGTATGGTFSFAALCIYGFNARDYPVQTADALTITWQAT
jgi:hypothetical protein